jgi:large subunit ribosomal protein L3
MIGLLGKKVGMSQIFDAEGQQIPVTVLEVGPCFVTALRTKEKHGYLGV